MLIISILGVTEGAGSLKSNALILPVLLNQLLRSEKAIVVARDSWALVPLKVFAILRVVLHLLLLNKAFLTPLALNHDTVVDALNVRR